MYGEFLHIVFHGKMAVEMVALPLEANEALTCLTTNVTMHCFDVYSFTKFSFSNNLMGSIQLPTLLAN